MAIGGWYLLLPFPVLALLLPFLFVRIDENVHLDKGARRILISVILSLPAIWLFLVFWDGFFWVDPSNSSDRNPDWVGLPLIIAPCVFLLAVGFYLWRLRGARLFTLTYALLNVYFLLGVHFLSIMVLSGTWL